MTDFVIGLVAGGGVVFFAMVFLTRLGVRTGMIHTRANCRQALNSDELWRIHDVHAKFCVVCRPKEPTS